VSCPLKVPFPDWEKDDDEILKIELGFKQSAILTKKKNLWITDPHFKSAPIVVEEKKVSVKEEKVSRKGRLKNADRTAQHEKLVKKTRDLERESEEPEHRWIEISETARSLKNKEEYQILTVCFNKDRIAVLGAFMGRRNEKNKIFDQLLNNSKSGQIHFQKLKGADQIINRIKWDKEQNKNEFTVGYDDRFLGIMDIPFVEFDKQTDIPSHRIKHFKRNGEIVWDRTNKVYNF